MALRRLPVRQRLVRFRDRRIHNLAVLTGAGGQFDDVAVGITEVDRPDKAMVDRATHLSTLRLGLLQHGVEGLGLDPECDVQIQRVLALEVEGRTGHFEKGEAGAVIHLEEGMERPAFVYLESANHPQTEKILVKSSPLLGITAAISIVVQPLDHPTLPSLQSIHTASLSFQGSRNSRPKPVIGVATPPTRSRRHRHFSGSAPLRGQDAQVKPQGMFHHWRGQLPTLLSRESPQISWYWFASLRVLPAIRSVSTIVAAPRRCAQRSPLPSSGRPARPAVSLA